ncbi:DegV family protein [Bacillus horti]|uniref:DegV family protein with EDD domain n=2 Tax=Caldalkalibacillus horti TaxID=77523 RepID=A0ABT9VX21_9BACI|nr:DegV family protein [Bacillus horti]MDQ0165538.1 DegV family protein with EDD domain [Bacillus horti]
MENIVYVLDSGSDFEREQLDKLNLQYPVEFIPLNIHIGDEVYLDGVNINKKEFYEKMAQSEELPKTSQPSPQMFFDMYKKLIDEGKQVVNLTLSSGVSGTYQSALIAKDMLEDAEKEHVHLVDTQQLSVTILLLLKKLDTLLTEGKSLNEAIGWLEDNKHKGTMFGLLDTLENLKKGGRISSAQAMIGGLLNIKPLVEIKDGKVESLGKARGRKKGQQLLADSIGSIDHYTSDSIFIAHNFATLDDAKQELSQILDVNAFEQVFYYTLGSTIGTHAGPNTLGIALMKK